MNLAREPSENELAYQIRLCQRKDEYGLSWKQIASLVNGELGTDRSSDYYRHWYAGCADGIDYEQTRRLSSDETLREFEDKRLAMEKERVRLADQRRTYAAIVREHARYEYIRELIENTVAQLSKEKPLQWSKPDAYSVNNVSGVACWNDWHYGAIADNYFNKYDTNVFYKRLDKLLTKTIEYGHLHGIHTLHVMNLADAINGHIHVSTRIQSSENAVHQTMRVAEVMSEALVRLASEFEHVKFYSTRGNHDRVQNGAKDGLIASESFAEIIPWFIKPRLAEADVTNVEIVPNTMDDGVIVARVQGHTILGCHGHLDKVDSVAANLSLMLKVIPSTILMGHFHHSWEKEATGGVDVVVSGSMIGTDEYAKDNVRKTSKPSQKLLIYDDSGRICTYNIDLR